MAIPDSPDATTTRKPDPPYDYDFVVIGGGSGGVSSARRAATLWQKQQRVAVIESSKWGGTCVNVGCVPKKIMYQAASIREILKEASHMYKFRSTHELMDWKAMKEARDSYILRLNNIYKNGLINAGVTVIEGFGKFLDAHTVEVTSSLDGTIQTLTADKILIAVGSKPMVLSEISGIEHTITSNGFFELQSQPGKVVVVGAGYIAVELAGVFNALGSDTHLVVRKQAALRHFDEDISSFLDTEMVRQKITVHRNTDGVARVDLASNGKRIVTTVSGEVIDNVDVVIMAPGRVPAAEGLNLSLEAAKDVNNNNDDHDDIVDHIPNTEGLNLPSIGVNQNAKNHIIVDDFQSTSIDNIFAVGDVTGRVELTPMAIAAGRRLADRLFGGFEHCMDKASYEFVPTVVFSHPTIGACGLTQQQAEEKYGMDNLKIYTSTFVNLWYSVYNMDPSSKPKTFAKLICAGIEEKVIGLHIIGMGADEILQGFAVAMKMGATKADFDSCVAIHPTAAEEIVTMGVWGTSPCYSGAKVSPVLGAATAEPTMKSNL